MQSTFPACPPTDGGSIRRLEDSPLVHRMVPQEDIEQLYRLYPELPKTHNIGCPACGKNRGKYVDGVVELPDGAWRCNCHDQLQRHKHYLNAGIGAGYQYIGWADFHGDRSAKEAASRYVSTLPDMVGSGCGIVFYGKAYGVGKTFLAALILKACVMAGYRCYMTTFADMLSSTKAGWKDADFSRWYRHKVDSAQALVLDDVGKELMPGSGFNNDFAVQTFDSLVRNRVQRGLPTFVTTNHTPKELASSYGAAVVSLLNEQGMMIEVTGADYRKVVRRLGPGHRRVF